MIKRNIRLQMLDSSIKKIEEMKKTLQTNNRSDIVKALIDIAGLVIGAIQEGRHVYIGNNKTIEQEIVVPAIKKELKDYEIHGK